MRPNAFLQNQDATSNLQVTWMRRQRRLLHLSVKLCFFLNCILKIIRDIHFKNQCCSPTLRKLLGNRRCNFVCEICFYAIYMRMNMQILGVEVIWKRVNQWDGKSEEERERKKEENCILMVSESMCINYCMYLANYPFYAQKWCTWICALYFQSSNILGAKIIIILIVGKLSRPDVFLEENLNTHELKAKCQRA